MREYDQIVEWYVGVRDPASGVEDLTDFARRLPPEARVLDLGCGNGVPMSRLLLRDGFEVVALDSSAEMIARFRAHFPGASARCECAQEATFEAESFEAVMAWGVLFHLSASEQRSVIAKVSGWLASGGRFLFTSGGDEGTREGEMTGVLFHYVSLGTDGYRGAIESAGMRLERAYVNAWGNHVYVAVKPL